MVGHEIKLNPNCHDLSSVAASADIEGQPGASWIRVKCSETQVALHKQRHQLSTTPLLHY